jgi:hypothetical protein
MQSSRAPRGPVTYGRADIDGDGSRDLVLVSTTGRVQVRLGGGGRLSGRVPADSSVRLQALTDMFATGEHDIVVASSAAGCCGYTFERSSSVVLQGLDGRLRALRTPPGPTLMVSFDTGSGDNYAGIRCSAGHLTATSVVQLGLDRLRVSTRRYRITGTLATLHDVAARVARAGQHQAVEWAATSCRGMNASGWAA